MMDLYDRYLRGMGDLLQAIEPTDADYLTVLTLQGRLAQAIAEIQQYGPTDNARAEIARVTTELDRLCLAHLGQSFRALCGIDRLPKAGPPEIHQNLPQPDYGRFVGREQELTRIREWLSATSSCSVVTIDGIGGIGKSALVLEAAYYYQRHYTVLVPEERFEAIIWTSAKQEIFTANGKQPRLHPQRTLNKIYSTIAVCLEREDITRADFEEQHELVRRALGRQRTLLIIDNLESMDDERVISFLYELPLTTKAIVTTRVGTRNWPTRIRLGEIAQSDAYVFLRNWPEAHSYLTNDQVDKLYECIGGVPLALKLCFALIDSSENLDVVVSELTEQPNREDVISFCLDFSWERLHQEASEACEVLKALALFDSAEGTTADALAFVIGDDTTQEMVFAQWREIDRLSLAAKGREGRYRLLPLVQRYVSWRLKDEEVNEWRRRQLQYYLENMLWSYVVHVDFVCGMPATQEHAKEIDNVDIVFKWCQTGSALDAEYLQFADGFSTLLYLIGRVNRAIEVAQKGREAAQRLGNCESQYDFCNKLTQYYTWSDRFDDAHSALKEAKALSAQVPEYRPDNVLEYVGSYLMRRYDGKQLYQAHEPLYQSTNIRENFDAPDKDRRVAVLGRFMMGVWYYRVAVRLKNKQSSEPADRKLLRELGIPSEYSREQAVEDILTRARGWLVRGLFLAEQIGFERGRSYILNYLGNIRIEQQQYAEAEKKPIRSLEIAENLKDRRRIARVQQSLFHLCRAQDKLNEARKWAERAVGSFEILGMRERSQVQDELRELAE